MKQDLEAIIELMEGLKDKMEYGEDDFSDRLGRKKPDLEMVKVSASPMEGDMDAPEMEGDVPMDGDMDMDDDESPEDRLKNRLMKLRG